ncbi:hypothetical protein Tco_0087943 [Tanacetum coccineum]
MQPPCVQNLDLYLLAKFLKATSSDYVSKLSNDSLLARGNILQSDEDRLKLDELMALCTTLQSRVLDLEKTKTTQANEIASLKRRVKKLVKKRSSRTHKLKRLYKVSLSARVESSGDKEILGKDASKQGRINDIDADEDITLVNVKDDVDKEMYDVSTVTGDEVFAEQEVAAKEVNLTVDEVTLAQALAALKSVKPKVKGDVIEEPNVPVNAASASIKVSAATTTTATIPTPRRNEEEEEEERLAREKAQQTKEANIAWDDVQAKIEADYQLAQRLQAQEQEELTDKEKARLFVQFLKQKRKHFAAKRAEEKRNRPPTRAQQRSIMLMKRVNTFVDYRTELVEKSSKKAKTKLEENLKKAKVEVMEGSSKRAGEELEQKSIKKQKMDKDKETTELQSLIEVIPDEEEVAIIVVPLATKPPTIVDWKIHKEGKKSYYQIIRADGKSQISVEDLDLILYGDLKTMFKPHVKDQVWKNQDDYNVLDWKLYNSCGVHSLRMQHVYIHMLVEKRYPLTPSTITNMLNKKLQVDNFSEMAYQLLKLLTKQLKNQ